MNHVLKTLKEDGSVATVACPFDRGYLYSLFKVSITCAFIRRFMLPMNPTTRNEEEEKKKKQYVTQLACDFKGPKLRPFSL